MSHSCTYLPTTIATREQSLTEGSVIPAWHFGFVVFCALTRFQVRFPNFRFVSPSPSLISLFCYTTNYQTTVPTVKRPFTNQKTFYNRIVDEWNSLDSSLQIINLIMVFVKSQMMGCINYKSYLYTKSYWNSSSFYVFLKEHVDQVCLFFSQFFKFISF